MERICKNCGASNWNKFLEQENGERGEKYTKEVFECDNCGAHGKRFEHPSNTIWSGAMRA